jgi:hypothetical protein
MRAALRGGETASIKLRPSSRVVQDFFGALVIGPATQGDQRRGDWNRSG